MKEKQNQIQNLELPQKQEININQQQQNQELNKELNKTYNTNLITQNIEKQQNQEQQQQEETNLIQSVLCVHGDGKGWNGLFWKNIMIPLAEKGFQVYAIDMPGCGQSQGNKYDFRNKGVEVLDEVIKNLGLKDIILCGESVGGRTVINFVNFVKQQPKLQNNVKIKMLVLTHPVLPSTQQMQEYNNHKIPTLVTWAEDDIQHPYNGPHGVRYIKQMLKCEILSWKEEEQYSISEFYKTSYCQKFEQLYNKNYKNVQINNKR
ncbi:hypothetical protein PPERSA_10887 [Pseudocohnilembus persalinus]|uniref:AB hydrolase-1 domain-containing protein n=1 Tax=Pseudocohnilembus persalinus TaxID=266149 RepID=A0A0V0R9P9_PSEPJ|nr:hypothetical protein PPERSA_10887 [Pseudocohnilembus persalinus]|eukprot:KRX11120.1 hypothetical protein PPERSA_10887 [Pseudocohnilembus persalinus]